MELTHVEAVITHRQHSQLHIKFISFELGEFNEYISYWIGACLWKPKWRQIMMVGTEEKSFTYINMRTYIHTCYFMSGHGSFFMTFSGQKSRYG